MLLLCLPGTSNQYYKIRPSKHGNQNYFRGNFLKTWPNVVIL